jgi:GntR family transcriptional regulator
MRRSAQRARPALAGAASSSLKTFHFMFHSCELGVYRSSKGILTFFKLYCCISTVIVHVHPASGVPLYLQIESQLKYAIAAGALKAGDALLPVRKLAAELRVNPNTVARAYQNLERDSVIRTVPGGGTYVAEAMPGLLKSEKLRRLRPVAMQLAVEGIQLRLQQEDILRLVRESLSELGGVE